MHWQIKNSSKKKTVIDMGGLIEETWGDCKRSGEQD